MTMLALSQDERRRWGVAGLIALTAHVVIVGLIVAAVRQGEPPLPDPVVLIDLPPLAAPAPSVANTVPTDMAQPDTSTPQPAPTPPIDIPPVRAPLPSNPVVLPPPSQPVRPVAAASTPAAPTATPTPAAAPPSTGATPNAPPINDPAARRREADYFALLSAHLNRRKTYPAEARQARQQGIVSVRFTVDRAGNVSNISIRRSSGHDLLDAATMALVQRVAPLPRMPASMRRDAITITLPIEYSLNTD